jgi:two-component system chemotaxis sensor kinase CheA
MDLEQARQTFLAESRELLQSMEEGLLRLESEPGDRDAINAVFRAVHTIKGSAGLFGLDAIVAFTHLTESVLDRVRADKLAVDTRLVGLMLECGDFIALLLERAAGEGGELEEGERARGEALAARLQRLLGTVSTHAPAAASALPPDSARPASDAVANDCWHISLRFGRDVLRNGMDPLSFIRYLAGLGEIASVRTLPDALPEAADMDPESCYLGFEIDLRSTADKAAIEGAFEFVRADCQLRILPPHGRLADYVQLIRELPEDKARLGDLLVESGALTRRELEEGLAIQSRRSEPASDTANNRQPLGEILVGERMVQQALVDAALDKQKRVRDAKGAEARLIRVQADKLDRLINLVGELVIAGAGVQLLSRRTGDMALLEASSAMGGLVEEIRDGALQLRMVQIGETFSRFHRVVREAARELGKDIQLAVSGADAELDKSVVEKIGDPLMHLVRNAMDHGIEAAEARAARGKPLRGTVRLNAYHDSGSIVIEVGDDGGGLNRSKILSKATERGRVAAGAALTDKEVYGLIFEPGFSTAEQVSSISGRGVGMDVVRRNIEALRGTVEIDSREGEGTTIRIRLPLTLAIIDGFLMRAAGTPFVVPLDMVLECIELSEFEQRAARHRDYLNLRGEVLPFLRVREFFGLAGKPARRQNIVVVQYAGRKAGLLVDELQGEFQTVIKPLGRLFARLKGVSGSSILGSGDVALILDVPALVARAVDTEQQRFAGRTEEDAAAAGGDG